jgi:hypothetical protein
MFSTHDHFSRIYFFKNETRRLTRIVNMMEMTREDARGITQEKFSLLMTKSPGRFPKGISNRAKRKSIPARINITNPNTANTRAIFIKSIRFP